MKISQKGAILELLQSKEIISLPELMNLKTANGMRIAAITARISDLRADGYDVVNFQSYDADIGCVVSSYSLRGE